jgi:ribosomal protein S18 acetylase RimI-like enzyme
MDNLFIVPEWRHMGVGEALLQRLATIAVERRYARLEWMVVNWNKSAICLYEAQGAAFMDDWTKCRMDEGAINALACSRK